MNETDYTRYLDDVQDALNEGFDLDELEEELYEREDNFIVNETTGEKVRIHSLREIKEFVDECEDKLKKEPYNCSNCGATILDENWIVADEDRGEFWGAPCTETIAHGYVCHLCGYEESD